ncbi:hypothetical protein SVA_2962 [Sulfurifustis variabilis]|uniref:Uncharacterized protein n=1 Tax=Sulfurifustis variabilis TaxID=1675686 RepID=A0A1B4V7L0_9GAMM|nr:hypothetical protein SVA_2962 [Sulfurifustis variabilis]
MLAQEKVTKEKGTPDGATLPLRIPLRDKAQGAPLAASRWEVAGRRFCAAQSLLRAKAQGAPPCAPARRGERPPDVRHVPASPCADWRPTGILPVALRARGARKREGRARHTGSKKQAPL